MKILLVTTLPNKVYDSILTINGVTLHCVDCADYNNIKQRVVNEVSSNNFSMLITYRCPYIIPLEVIEKIYGCAYNIHPSLLPKYPGLNPWEEIIRNGDNYSGVTLHHLTSIPDGGEILKRRRFKICKEASLEYNRNQADIIASKLIKEFILLT